MSYFEGGIIYIIVPTTSVTTEMINNMKVSFNSTEDTIRVSTGTPEKKLFKVKNPISSAFNGYEWFSHNDILFELEKQEWQ